MKALITSMIEPIAEPEGEIEPPQPVMLAMFTLYLFLCVVCWLVDLARPGGGR